MRLPAPQGRRGFTLVEVAVTLIIVGITLLWVLEGMNRAKMTAAQTHNSKLAAELALQTLAEIESGLYWEDIDQQLGLMGNYAEEGYEAFAYEVVLGDETFTDASEEEEGTLPHDAFDEKLRKKEEAEREKDDSEEEDEVEEVYERVKIKVTFPKTTEETPEVILERWIPWIQVYGQEAEADSTSTGGTE